eukprot:scaffold125029_cov19-Tisochrysis_lutea.AAC.1
MNMITTAGGRLSKGGEIILSTRHLRILVQHCVHALPVRPPAGRLRNDHHCWRAPEQEREGRHPEEAGRCDEDAGEAGRREIPGLSHPFRHQGCA